ncbi:hypothetical protein BDR07DRAFT_463998 [Suillus spraguei]|nr:hypothetical protein BDR07DRAFT_463998 [Suillus spraguei]
MAPIIKCLAFLSLVLSVTALTSPHISNNVFDHRRSVARVAVQATHDQVDTPPAPKRKRSLNKRCVPKSSGNSTVSSSLPSASGVPVNVLLPLHPLLHPLLHPRPRPLLPHSYPHAHSHSHTFLKYHHAGCPNYLYIQWWFGERLPQWH